MYFNNLHILTYVTIGILGLIVGKIIAWTNMRLPENKKIFNKDFFKENKNGLEKNYVLMIIMAVLYIALLYKLGIKKQFSKNLDLIKYLTLIPMLISSCFMWIKNKNVPNRVNLTMFELGLILTFICGITNINIAKDMILGMFVGAIVFIILTFLGKLITGKESMKFDDVKFMGALGLYFGVNKITEVALFTFFTFTISSIVILIVRFVFLKNKDEYIPFGPFLCIISILDIFLPTNFLFTLFVGLCTGISNKIIEVIN